MRSGTRMRLGHPPDGVIIRQEAGFFGSHGERVFGSRSVPLKRTAGGVVVCSSVHAEFPKNYRREVLLARALAAQGLAVQRFHYRGAGHSDGDALALNFDALVEDAVAAADHLGQETGVTRVAFLGTRLGGLVAAAAARVEGAPLALWDPVIDAVSFFRDVFRARLMSGVSNGSARATSGESLLQELRATGWVDVLGYPVGWSLYESLQGHDLRRLAGDERRPVLLVQFGGEGALRPGYAALERRWREQGWHVVSAAVASEEAWWFTSDPWRPDVAITKATALLDLTVGWLLQHAGAVGARS